MTARSETKKLIEVTLPLRLINQEAVREKSIRHGHPSTMHIWWARRPLAACRAVLFASLVDDPSSHLETFPTDEAQALERERLFRIIEELVKWENTNNETVLEAAREEIRKSTGGNPPPILDPFCGGGSIPLEAQRLGLRVHASDLNPVAVAITKALVEIPPKFAGRPPVNPDSRKKLNHTGRWQGAHGLAEDVKFYAEWMRSEALKHIQQIYPKVRLPGAKGGGEAVVIAWIWARTVICPNPACRARMPLVRTFWLSNKSGNKAWIDPIVEKALKKVHFEVKTGSGSAHEGTVNRRGATCIVCGTSVPFDHVRAEGRAGRMGMQLMAIVAEGQKGRAYLSPNEEHVAASTMAIPKGVPETDLPEKALSFRVQLYGMTKHRDLFTQRQLVALTTFSDLVSEARDRVLQDARASNLSDDGRGLDEGGTGAAAYADALAIYLAFGVDRSANYWSSLTPWGGDFIVQTFGRQALPMVWDFAEGNPFSDSTGNWSGAIDWIVRCLLTVVPARGDASIKQLDATAAIDGLTKPLVCTDPPYYDNIGYADLSDFFYIWLRRSIGKIYPSLFSTVLTPKQQELIATPFRFGGDREKANRFFQEGLARAFAAMRQAQTPDYPLTLFYAFKQAETEEIENGDGTTGSETVSTGWETMLEGLLQSKFMITGTWPLRTERDQGLKSGTNVLASSIVLVCRLRATDAPLATRREFLDALKRELPTALRKLQLGNIAPVDLAQAAIGPGMAVFSRYARVLEADGAAMTVRTALGLINQTFDDVLAEQESEFDPDTRWALAWFEQFGMEEGSFGVAETLSKAKNTAVNGLVEAGILATKSGKVRLLKTNEIPTDWDPTAVRRLTIWEVTQHLIRSLDRDGEAGAAVLFRKIGSLCEVARDLAYRLYSICERKKWAQEALAYNSLVIAWPEIARLAKSDKPREQQTNLKL